MNVTHDVVVTQTNPSAPPAVADFPHPRLVCHIKSQSISFNLHRWKHAP